MPHSQPTVSRRTLFGVAALGVGLAVAASGAGAAPKKKLSHAAAQYQDKPKGQARCINCKLWQPPGGCETVESPIDPIGWCSLYVAKF